MMNYASWQKRNLLVVRMITSSTLIEDRLTLLNIPFTVYDSTKHDHLDWEKLRNTVCGIVISGSISYPEYNLNPAVTKQLLDSDVPKLGVCYGHEIIGNHLGSIVDSMEPVGEYSTTIVKFYKNPIFNGIDVSRQWTCTMKHDYSLENLPPGAVLIAETDSTPIAGFYHEASKSWGLQFHPEKDWLGDIIFPNFYRICHPTRFMNESLSPKLNPRTVIDMLKVYADASTKKTHVTPINSDGKFYTFTIETNIPGDTVEGSYKSYKVMIDKGDLTNSLVETWEDGKMVFKTTLEVDGERDMSVILTNFIEAAELYDDTSAGYIVDARDKVKNPDDIKRMIKTLGQ